MIPGKAEADRTGHQGSDLNQIKQIFLKVYGKNYVKEKISNLIIKINLSQQCKLQKNKIFPAKNTMNQQ